MKFGKGAASRRRLNRERSGAFCEHSVSAQKTSTASDEGYFLLTGFGSRLTASRGISKYPPDAEHHGAVRSLQAVCGNTPSRAVGLILTVSLWMA